MENDFKKKMQEIAKLKLQKEQNQIDSKELLKEKEEKEKKSKKEFNELTKSTIIPTTEELNQIFKETGNKFLFFSNDKATSEKDQARSFCQVFYYQKGREQNKVGLNTASILFECLPEQEEVKILSNFNLHSAPLKELDTIKLSGFNKAKIESYISDFVSNVTN